MLQYVCNDWVKKKKSTKSVEIFGTIPLIQCLIFDNKLHRIPSPKKRASYTLFSW